MVAAFLCAKLTKQAGYCLIFSGNKWEMQHIIQVTKCPKVTSLKKCQDNKFRSKVPRSWGESQMNKVLATPMVRKKN